MVSTFFNNYLLKKHIKKLAAISLLYRSLSFRETQKLAYTQKVVNSSQKLIAHGSVYKIEDITWLRGDTKFLFEC